MRITHIGHAGFLVETDQIVVATIHTPVTSAATANRDFACGLSRTSPRSVRFRSRPQSGQVIVVRGADIVIEIRVSLVRAAALPQTPYATRGAAAVWNETAA